MASRILVLRLIYLPLACGAARLGGLSYSLSWRGLRLWICPDYRSLGCAQILACHALNVARRDFAVFCENGIDQIRIVEIHGVPAQSSRAAHRAGHGLGLLQTVLNEDLLHFRGSYAFCLYALELLINQFFDLAGVLSGLEQGKSLEESRPATEIDSSGYLQSH